MKLFGNRSLKAKDPGKVFIGYSILISVGLVIVMLLITVIVFIVKLEGKEKVEVPDVVMMKLEDAMIELQERRIIPYIHLVYTSDDDDKGLVMVQSPASGTTVKADARVVLSVSKGKVIDKLEDYRGQNIEIVKNEIRNNFPDVEILPFTERTDETPYGTILDQKPLPGEKITSDTVIKFIISRGQEGEIVQVPLVEGMSYMQAIRQCAAHNLTFFVALVKNTSGDVPGSVKKQNPEFNSRVPRFTQLEFEIIRPEELDEGVAFGYFDLNITPLAVPSILKIYKITPEGITQPVIEMKHPGGLLRFPYLEKKGTTFIVKQDDIEVFEYIVSDEQDEKKP
ncbi:MAG: PASTA domain-containing protein [Spirochaetales bacterium]|nr:PASTA domain-containing protein [Spirochaetales bacterium]